MTCYNSIQIFFKNFGRYLNTCCVAWWLAARSLVVGDLRSETKGSWLESSCQLCAEVSPPQQSPGQYLSTHKAGGSGSEELNRYPPLPLLPRESWMLVKENLDRKKTCFVFPKLCPQAFCVCPIIIKQTQKACEHNFRKAQNNYFVRF